MSVKTTLHNWWAASLIWIKTHPRKRLIVGGGILIGIALVVTAVALSRPLPAVDTTPIKVTKPAPKPKFYSPLTGELVENEAATKQAVTGIMIENSPDARPQSGLKEAGVVYEAIAEGGITRFLAIYQHQKPQLIGPVRSVRMYYVDWIAPYQASVAHIGGSANALAEVRNGTYRDIDQFFNAPSYWRASDRAAPHNVYTSFEKLDALNQAKGFTTSEYKSFPRSDKKDAALPAVTSIDINFSSTWYNTHYDYVADTNSYTRSAGGELSADREKGQIAPTVVVAMHVDMSTILEDGYRGSITTTGSGKAEVFQNGKIIDGTWRKASRADALELLDASGKPLELARGQTWIAAVPNDRGSVSWQ
jgi:hypothetical protein